MNTVVIMSQRYSQHVSRTSNLCPSTYMYPDTSCSSGTQVSGQHVSWCKRGLILVYTGDVKMREADTSRDDVKECHIADSLAVGDLEPSQLSTAPSNGLQPSISQPPTSAQYDPLHRQTNRRRVSTQNPRQGPETTRLKPGFHYPSSRPVNSGRELG